MGIAAQQKPPDESSAMTPMMAQYWEIKNQYPDALLFFRMGDFYELFFDDAVKAAATLDITLTRRGKHQGDEIPMCGVPWHQAEPYLEKLIAAGFSVAVCEQMEDPAEAKKRGAKSVVQRDVIRLVTPGTLTEDSLLDGRENNYLAALARHRGQWAAAWIDLSTGAFYTEDIDASHLRTALARIQPREILIADHEQSLRETLKDWKSALKLQPGSWMSEDSARQRLTTFYGVKSLESFGPLSAAAVCAAGAVIQYVELTQKGKMPHLSSPQPIGMGDLLEMDSATLRNLEILRTTDGQRKGSLLASVDRTSTAPGGRLLAQRLSAPSTRLEIIRQRLAEAQGFVDGPGLHEKSGELLRGFPDIERALSRVHLDRASPRDLAAIRDGLEVAALLKDLARQNPPVNPALRQLFTTLPQQSALIVKLREALKDDLPYLARDGGFIRAGFNTQLDAFRELRDESKKHIAALQTRYVEISGITTLKIRHNNILGYYAEVPPRQADKMGEPFIHRQTLANAVRYSTTELAELESRLAKADDQAKALELQIFETLCGEIKSVSKDIATTAQTIAALDVAAATAVLAAEDNYNAPELSDDLSLEIEAGRHPVVEAALREQGEAFIANSCALTQGQRLWLLTGPNMAGKSTFLRQNALIVIMAQAGLFVPAASAKIGVVDRLFSRVGASDDLARGHSTFMVEMLETATILNRASDRSLVILDEIGRGTATYDGMSIAWGTLEHLHDVNRARGLFATHYHELGVLCQRLDDLAPYTMRVKEWQDSIVFLHDVMPGQADRSYGIHVAKLAGLPAAVIRRAEEVLDLLEKKEQGQQARQLMEDLPLFQQTVKEEAPAFTHHPLYQKLCEINPDGLSPRQALDLIYEIKDLLK